MYKLNFLELNFILQIWTANSLKGNEEVRKTNNSGLILVHNYLNNYILVIMMFLVEIFKYFKITLFFIIGVYTFLFSEKKTDYFSKQGPIILAYIDNESNFRQICINLSYECTYL